MRIVTLAMLAVLGGVLASCGDERGNGTPAPADSTSAGETALQVVASFYPLWEFSRAVGGHRVSVENLTAAGSEPHDLELSPGQVEVVRKADLVVYIPDFQPAVDRAIEATGASERALDVGAAIATPEGGDDAGDGQFDPHVWLDFRNAERIVDSIRDRLIALDPGGRASYEANAAAYVERLRALNQEYEEGLAQCVRREILTAHDAFGYLARAYGLEQFSIAGVSPDAQPSPAQLERVIDFAEEHDVKVVFLDALGEPQLAETVAEAAGTETRALNPLEGLTEEDQEQGKDFFAVARDNLAALRYALDCS